MSTRLVRSAVTVAVAFALLVPLAVPSAAQETEQPVACDATLVTLMLVAVQDYGYEPPLRYDLFDYGQYRPLVEVVTGQPLPEPQEPVAPDTAQEAQASLQEAAADLEARGWGALGEGLADISDEVAGLLAAGEQVLQQGQAAIQAGTEALQQREPGDLLSYGSVSGQHDYCDFLRVDLVDFMWARLREQNGIQ